MSRRTAELLARHAGHRLEVLDAERTRCLDCSHTLLLAHGGTVMTEQDRPAHVTASSSTEPCPLHVGELARSCRCCRADRLARPDDVTPLVITQPTADVASWAAACRAALPKRSTPAGRP